MPSAQLPTTTAGWIVTLISSVVGFLAGFLVLVVARRFVTEGG